MAKQKKLITARHFKHGDTQTFKESHWRLVNKSVWIEIPSKAENTPLPEVAADIQQRIEAQEPQTEPPAKKAGRPKNESL